MQTNQAPLADNPADSESPQHAFLALVITCLLAVMVPAMVALIGYRSIMIHGPSTALLIEGDASVDGAKIEVTESVEPHRKWMTALDHGNNWRAPILLDPGPYHVSVNHKGKEILSSDFAPDQLNGVEFDVHSMVTVIGNAVLADSRIEIVRLTDSQHPMPATPIKVDVDNRYRDTAYLAVGDYRLIAHSTVGPDRIVMQTDFKVDHKTPTVIDLNHAGSAE